MKKGGKRSAAKEKDLFERIESEHSKRSGTKMSKEEWEAMAWDKKALQVSNK